MKTFLHILELVGPSALAAVVPGVGPFIPVIVAAIGAAHQIEGASGADKKAHVLSIATATLDVAHATGVHIDPALTLAAISSGIDAVVAGLKVIEGTKVAVSLEMFPGAVVPA